MKGHRKVAFLFQSGQEVSKFCYSSDRLLSNPEIPIGKKGVAKRKRDSETFSKFKNVFFAKHEY